VNTRLQYCQLATHVVHNVEWGRMVIKAGVQHTLPGPIVPTVIFIPHFGGHNNICTAHIQTLLLAFDVCLCTRINKGRVCVCRTPLGGSRALHPLPPRSLANVASAHFGNSLCAFGYYVVANWILSALNANIFSFLPTRRKKLHCSK